MQQSIKGLSAICLLAAVHAIAQAATPQSPVPSTVDITHVTGLWYEIAVIPKKAERECIGDAILLLARADNPNHLDVVNSCRTKSDVPRVRNAIMAPGKLGEHALKVQYLWPFWKKYRVVAMEPGYAWFVLGNTNHKELWIYARTSTLTPDLLTTIENEITARGYPAEKLRLTIQSQRSLQTTP